jgi:hypothetical protein
MVHPYPRDASNRLCISSYLNEEKLVVSASRGEHSSPTFFAFNFTSTPYFPVKIARAF